MNPTLPEDVRATSWKVQSDVTLKGKTKDQLIEIIRCLEHNYFGSQQTIERQYQACNSAKAEGYHEGVKAMRGSAVKLYEGNKEKYHDPLDILLDLSDIDQCADQLLNQRKEGI